MKLKVKDGTYVFDVQCKDGEVDEFTLDSSEGEVVVRIFT